MDNELSKTAHFGFVGLGSGKAKETAKHHLFFPILWLAAALVALIVGIEAGPVSGDSMTAVVSAYLNRIELWGDITYIVKLAVSLCAVDLISLGVIFFAGFSVYPAAFSATVIVIRAGAFGFIAGAVSSVPAALNISPFSAMFAVAAQIVSAAALCYLAYSQVAYRSRTGFSDLPARLFRLSVSSGIALIAAAIHLLACRFSG